MLLYMNSRNLKKKMEYLSILQKIRKSMLADPDTMISNRKNMTRTAKSIAIPADLNRLESAMVKW